MKKKKEEELVVIPRYSDSVLLEFKQLILSKIEEEQAYLDDEENLLAREHILKFIDKLSGALLRIEDKSYGRCVVTGKLICVQRLRSALCATVSVEAKPQQKKEEEKQAIDKRAKVASSFGLNREKLETPVLLTSFR